MMKKKAVIFDLDGTLWDTSECSSDIWNRVLEGHKEISFRMTPAIASGLMGKTMEEIGKQLFPDLPEDIRRAAIDGFSSEEVRYLRENGAVLFEGVRETIAALADRYDLYIVSNCQDGYVPAFLHAHDLARFFKDFEMSGRTGLDKGSNIRLIMDRNDIVEAVYVGDTQSDEEAARSAGIPFIWAEYGFGAAKSPDAVIRSIAELPALIRTSNLLYTE